MTTIPYWRNIYQAVSGNCNNLDPAEISTIIAKVANELLEGIATYSTFTTDSFTQWKLQLNLNNKDLENLISRISKALNLDCFKAWGVFCNYLMYEYFGKVDDVQEIIQVEMNTRLLIEKIWNFYSSERLFLIRSLQTILNNYRLSDHILYPFYTDFMITHTLIKIRKSLYRQLCLLYEEIAFENRMHCVSRKEWVDRNNREQLLLILSIISILSYESISAFELIDVLNIFKIHEYTLKPPHSYEFFVISSACDLQAIQKLELASFLVILSSYWENPELWCKHIHEIETVIFDNELSRHVDGYDVIEFAWTLLNLSLPEDSIKDKFERLYNPLLHRITGTIFTSLYKIVSLPCLEYHHCEIIIKSSILDLMEVTCQRFTDYGFIYSKPECIQTFASLLKNPILTKRALSPDTIVYKSVYEVSMDMFPYDFESFTTIQMAMLTYPQFVDKVIGSLQAIDTFAEEYNDGDISGSIKISTAYYPFGNDLLEIPPRSVAVIREFIYKTILQFNGPFQYSYYTIVQYQFYLFLSHDNFNEIDYSELNEWPIVETGLKLIVKILRLRPEVAKNEDIRKIFNYIRYLFPKFSTEQDQSLLFQQCFDLCSALMYTSSAAVVNCLLQCRALPILTRYEIGIPFSCRENIMDGSILLHYIYKEIFDGKYYLLFSYIQFLGEAIQQGHYYSRVLHPGLIFLFNYVFPKHLHWTYVNVQDKPRIALNILTIFKNILGKNKHLLQENGDIDHEFCQHLCIETLLNSEGFIKTFLAILRTTNTALEMHMYRECNWESEESSIHVMETCITLCVDIIFMLYDHKVENEIFKSSFWKYFCYCGVNYPSMIKVITDYINYKFNSALPIITCKLLNKLCKDPNIPILASLEMNDSQLKMMFLERLRDPLESEQLKCSIVEIVTTCIKSQNAITAAFFGVSSDLKPTDEPGDSILEYMLEYLQNLNKSPEYLRSPLQAAILQLFYTVWIHDKTVLIYHMLEQEEFWWSLTKPFMKPYTLSHHLYSQILEIVAFELSRTEDVVISLLKVVAEMFMFNSYLLKHFPKYLLQCLQTNTPDNELVKMIKSWAMVVIFLVKNEDQINIDNSAKSVLIHCNINLFSLQIQNPTDVRLTLHLSEINLYLFTKWGNIYHEKERYLQIFVHRIFLSYEKFYHFLGDTCKKTIISIAIKCFEIYKDNFYNISETSKAFLEILGNIFEKEHLFLLAASKSDSKIVYGDHVSFTLLIILTRQLLQIQNDETKRWFLVNQIAEKVLTALSFYSQHDETISFGKICGLFLNDFVLSGAFHQISLICLETFYCDLQPKYIFFDIHRYHFTREEIEYYQEYWLTYTTIINFSTTIVQKYKISKLRIMLLRLLFMHKDILQGGIKLPKITGEMEALSLASASIRFISEMITYVNEWHEIYPAQYELILKSLCECMNNCTNVFVRPKVLKHFSFNESDRLRAVDVKDFVIVARMNKYAEIVQCLCECFLKLSPDLIKIIQNKVKREKYYINIKSEFNYPLSDDSFISYGSLCSLAQQLCKILAQIQITRTRLVDSLDRIDIPENEPGTQCIALVFPGCANSINFDDKKATILNWLAFDRSYLSDPWIHKLDKEQLICALELLSTLIASQVFLILAAQLKRVRLTFGMDTWSYPKLKRDLWSELQCYYDFARKSYAHCITLDGCIALPTINGKTEECDNDYILLMVHWFMNVYRLSYEEI